MTQEPRYRLRILSPDEPPREFPLERPVIQIGRDPGSNDLVLAHGWVSRIHARLYCDREPYRIQDMGSSNGTFVNDRPLAREEIIPLQAGDVIAIGPFRLLLETIPAPIAEQEREIPSEEEGQEFAASIMERLGRPRISRQEATVPPTPPTEGPPPTVESPPLGPWIGVSRKASQWLQYLPPIYAESDFLGRYLLIFEDLLAPIQQIIAHLDFFLDPVTAPATFLPWLNDWMGGIVDERWPIEIQRELLKNAYWLYQALGTRAGLVRHLEIVTRARVEIEENVDGPHTFRVIVHANGQPMDRRILEHIIERNRPAHTAFRLDIL